MVKTIEWFDDRFYVITDEKGKEKYLPSSTTILGAAPKPYLAHWRGTVGNREADKTIDEALQKGSNVHEAIRIWIAGGTVIYNNPKRPAHTPQEIEEIINLNNGNEFIVLKNQQEQLEVFRLTQWFEEVKPLVIGTEMTVYSLKHGYAGTLDLLIDIKAGKYDINGSKPMQLPEGRYIVDFKTGNSFDEKNYFRQIASYKIAAEESGEIITGGLIIHTNENKVKNGIEGLKTYYRDAKGLDTSFKEFKKIKAVYELELDYEPKVFELPSILKRKVEAL